MFCVIYTSNITLVEHGKSTQFQTLCEDLETLQEHIKEHYFGTFYSKESQHRHCMMNIWKDSRNTVEYFRNCLKILFDQFGASSTPAGSSSVEVFKSEN